ncbi:MAG TPA: hypothetical protein VJT67_09420 [Longimicrobiaceae bacterium]|nr:hypothetical protein [Longimicrobiaceae bacterium]
MERAKRYGLAALMAFLALNIWTGAPLLALWIGSRVQGSESQASMTAVVAVVACLAAFSIALYQALKHVMHAYQEATGTLPTVRTHAPWLQSLSGERPSYGASRISGAERVIVVTVVIAALVFEVWFFFFSGSPIG